jgi:hypothetical protein
MLKAGHFIPSATLQYFTHGGWVGIFAEPQIFNFKIMTAPESELLQYHG